jgi:6-phosphogluconolactonase (cycloisomerase 2 family)
MFVVSCYSRFDNLAHGPRGTQADKFSIYNYAFNSTNGTMTLLSVAGSELTNPAFSRMHPTLPILYTVTEDISVNGEIIAFKIAPDGSMKKICQQDAGGTSTCYITIDRQTTSKLIVANYWNSTLVRTPRLGASRAPHSA